MNPSTVSSKQITHDLKYGLVLPSDTEPVIEGYKYPLSPVNNGHGYYGTLAYDKTGNFTQCHICGYFYKGLPWHIAQSHSMTGKQYRLEFGLSNSTSLIAPQKKKAWALPQLDAWDKVDRKTMIANLRKGWEATRHIKRTKSLEQKNKEGRCSLQLLDKIIKLKNYLGKMPTRREFGKYYNQGYERSAITTFETWNNAKEAALEMELAETTNLER